MKQTIVLKSFNELPVAVAQLEAAHPLSRPSPGASFWAGPGDKAVDRPPSAVPRPPTEAQAHSHWGINE